MSAVWLASDTLVSVSDLVISMLDGRIVELLLVGEAGCMGANLLLRRSLELVTAGAEGVGGRDSRSSKV